ncbi:MAG: hypothetical protein NUV72_09230 [Bauldia sp.]|nr:hypothetical protein [Bauldia sp.]
MLPPLLSDQPPEVPQRAGLGDRFHYFRGESGRRYLFSTVPAEELCDFHSAVVIFARRASGGRLSAHWIGLIDPFGRPEGRDRRRPPVQPDTVALVHLLSPNEAARRDLVTDLSAMTLLLAA